MAQTGHDGEIAAKDHAVETGQYAVNAILIFVDEFLHGSSLLHDWDVIELKHDSTIARLQ